MTSSNHEWLSYTSLLELWSTLQVVLLATSELSRALLWTACDVCFGSGATTCQATGGSEYKSATTLTGANHSFLSEILSNLTFLSHFLFFSNANKKGEEHVNTKTLVFLAVSVAPRDT